MITLSWFPNRFTDIYLELTRGDDRWYRVEEHEWTGFEEEHEL